MTNLTNSVCYFSIKLNLFFMILRGKMKSIKKTYNNYVFWGSLFVLFSLIIYVLVAGKDADKQMEATKNWINTNFSWFYILTVAIVLFAAIFLFCSKYGNIKLGPDHSEPEYSNVSWISMLFAAGMGIGIMFWSVAEPIMHYITPPNGDPKTIEAAKESMKIVFFHWGLSAWAIYAVIAVILAYFSFRHHLPLTLRSALYPLIGQRIYGGFGNLMDIFAVLGTIIGVATTLGMGVSQINAGLSYLYGFDNNIFIQICLIIGIICIVALSVLGGMDKGVKRLSELNMFFAVLLLLFVFFFGPTLYITQTFIQNIGDYLSDLVQRTFTLYAYYKPEKGDVVNAQTWIGNWTIFYWAWWLAWAPFVGLFIARISRGRTIKQFIAGALFVPTLFTLFWMTVFGDTALHQVIYGQGAELLSAIETDYSQALFYFLESFPLPTLSCFIAIFMIFLFFVTSADSAAIVIDMFASNGKTNNPKWQALFWVVIIALITIILMSSDGLKALQTASIISALPFAVTLLIALLGLMKALVLDVTKKEVRQNYMTISSPFPRSVGGWQRRLRNLTLFTRRSHVERYITEVVQVAFTEISEELIKQGFTTNIEYHQTEGSIKLELLNDTKCYFLYAVHPKMYPLPEIIDRQVDTTEEGEINHDPRNYFRADVHLIDGGQDYDIMGWAKEDVIGDILDQYEKHLHYLHLTR